MPVLQTWELRDVSHRLEVGHWGGDGVINGQSPVLGPTPAQHRHSTLTSLSRRRQGMGPLFPGCTSASFRPARSLLTLTLSSSLEGVLDWGRGGRGCLLTGTGIHPGPWLLSPVIAEPSDVDVSGLWYSGSPRDLHSGHHLLRSANPTSFGHPPCSPPSDQV